MGALLFRVLALDVRLGCVGLVVRAEAVLLLLGDLLAVEPLGLLGVVRDRDVGLQHLQRLVVNVVCLLDFFVVVLGVRVVVTALDGRVVDLREAEVFRLLGSLGRWRVHVIVPWALPGILKDLTLTDAIRNDLAAHHRRPEQLVLLRRIVLGGVLVRDGLRGLVLRFQLRLAWVLHLYLAGRARDDVLEGALASVRYVGDKPMAHVEHAFPRSVQVVAEDVGGKALLLEELAVFLQLVDIGALFDLSHLAFDDVRAPGAAAASLLARQGPDAPTFVGNHPTGLRVLAGTLRLIVSHPSI